LSVVLVFLVFLVFFVLSMRYTSIFCTLCTSGTTIVSPPPQKICKKILEKAVDKHAGIV